MDIVTLGAALNGSAEYVNSHFKGGSNIQIVDNPDGTQTINASGEVSAEDTVARADIAAIKDGETLDSFGDVETALATKADSSTTYTKTEVDTALANKVDKETGKGLSTNDYTTAEKTKLAGIAEGAEVNEIQGIKVNNTTINPDANKVVNITVPTTAADVSALPDTTKYAVALSLTINSSTYVMTGQLKDQNGDNLGTAQTIDLPLESVVVGGSYNSQTKKVVLTLQNGNTIEFSVADLVSGLQTELSASNKLNPAFIEYDSTHRAVSDTEKSAWNSKQNALSSTQLAAVNSGIDSTKVAQIETNKSNILLIADQSTQYNVFDFANAELLDIYHITATKTDTSLSVTSTGNWSRVQMPVTLKAGTYQFQCKITNYNAERNSTTKITIQTAVSGGTVLGTAWFNRIQTATCSFTISSDSTIYICVHANWSDSSYTNTYTASEFMITPKSLYDSGFTDYQPYALPNTTLTPALVECVDNGAKNKIIPTATSQTIGEAVFTINSDKTVSVYTTATTTQDRTLIYSLNTGYCNKGDILSGIPKTSVVCDIRYGLTESGNTGMLEYNEQLGYEVMSATGIIRYIGICIRKGQSISQNSPLVFKPMICTEAEYKASQTYQPYAMSNAELTAKEQQNENNISLFHKTAGTGIYFSETEPTGNIPADSYWISTTATKIYHISANLLDWTNVQDHYNIDFTGYPVAYSTSIDDRCATTTPIDVSNYDSVTLSFISNDITIIYSLFNGSSLLGRVVGGSSPLTISTLGATSLYLCWYKTNTFINKTDITDAMLNSGDSVLPYENYGNSWV